MRLRTREYEFALPGQTVRLLVVSNAEELITDPNDEDAVPCWAYLWPAARGLAHYIWQHLAFAGATVLELGCGLGLPGITCGLKGALVTFSDFNPDALELALENARRNGVRARAVRADWRDFQLAERFDWIVGSDICYDPKLNRFLKEIFRRNLKPAGRLLLAHPGRPATATLVSELCAAGFDARSPVTVGVAVEDTLLPYYEIFIHELTRRSS